MMLFLKNVIRLIVLAHLTALLFSCSKPVMQAPQKRLPVYYQSATELARSIREKEISSLDLLDIYLDRIQRYNGQINAVVALDIEAARARARAADEALAKGENWGPLHGLPMTVKDVFEAVGMPATSGDLTLKDYFPEKNALAVQKLVDAGAIVFGKTNVPFHAMDIQSYNKIYGTTNNPWDLERTPGGSSGGAAAALAAGFTALEIGSDIGGSLRTPAHFNGVFGHKPTFGLVSRAGHIPPMPSGEPPQILQDSPLWVVGPLARSADDLELAMKILVDDKHGAANESEILLPPRQKQFSDYRVAAWLTDLTPGAQVDIQVMASLQQTVKRLTDAGLKVDVQARPNISLTEIVKLYQDIFKYSIVGKRPMTKALMDRQEKLENIMADFFKSYDVILAPVTPTAAFYHDTKTYFMSRTIMVNGKEASMLDNYIWVGIAVASNLPATVAPVGFTYEGLPVGIQIIGARNEDLTTIDFARGLSKLMGGFKVPPKYEK